MYILGKALSMKLRKKMHAQHSRTSKAGLKDRHTRYQAVFYIKLFYLTLIDMGPNGGTSWHFGGGADVLQGLFGEESTYPVLLQQAHIRTTCQCLFKMQNLQKLLY